MHCLEYQTASSGNLLPTFHDNLSLKMGPIGCPETSGINYLYLSAPSSRLLKMGPIGCPETSGINYLYLSVPSPRLLMMGPVGCPETSGINYLFLSVPSSRFFKMGPIGCPETSTINYQYLLRNDTEERWFHLLRGGSLISPVRMPLQVYWGPKRVHLFLSTPPEERSGQLL